MNIYVVYETKIDPDTNSEWDEEIAIYRDEWEAADRRKALNELNLNPLRYYWYRKQKRIDK